MNIELKQILIIFHFCFPKKREKLDYIQISIYQPQPNV